MNKIIVLLLIFVPNFEITCDDNAENSEEETATPPNIEAQDAFTKCYGDLGCVTADETWFHKKFRPVNFKPLDKDVIKTEFILIEKKRKNELLSQVISTTKNSIKSAAYLPGVFLFVLIHDFTSNGHAGWIKHMTRTLKSSTKKCNVISVDWHGGAGPPYDQAVGNSRVVALEIVFLLKFLKENHELTMEQVHLIGHGLGAHIAGYVGISLKPRKISGLDPNGPRFDGMPRHVKLDDTDADYVEVLHTDAEDYTSQGSKEIQGHTDFFINDAETQPGCPREQVDYDLLTVTRSTLAEGEVMPGCSHKRSYKYYIESLDNGECTFLGIKCQNYEEFVQGRCSKCGPNCRTFGLVTYNHPNNGSYFLQTASTRPYCLFQYRVSLQISGPKSEYFGSFTFFLVDKFHFITKSSVMGAREFKPGAENHFVFYAAVPEMARIISAKVGWMEGSSNFCIFNCKRFIGVDKITVQSVNSRSSRAVSLCPKDGSTEIQSGEYTEFSPCK